MGLDMYAYATKEPIEEAVDFSEPENTEDVHYWRKHPNLHGWMEQLYRERGGDSPDFNLDRLRLTDADLDALEAAVRGSELPQTEGFFFGQSDGSERDDDLEFIRKARAAMADGKTVFYIAWW